MILKVEYEVTDSHIDLCPTGDAEQFYVLEELSDELLSRLEVVPYNIPVALHTDDFGKVAEWCYHKGVLELTCTLNQLNQIVQNKFTFKNEE